MNNQTFRNNDPGTIRKRKLLFWMLLVPFLTGGLNAYSRPVYEDMPAVQQQQRKITGIVLDATGEPVIGAAVKMLGEGAAQGTITDFEGQFVITGPAAAFQLEISYIGFKKKVVNVVAGKNKYNVQLVEDTQLLDEVVVVGFGTQKKETVTGAISMVQTKELVQSPQANVSNMLAGRMPGLLAVQRSGEPGSDYSTLRVRGVATFADGEGSQEPLVMVDGIETTNFNNIDPNEIESLSILKDASSTAVYGVRGANGVILITTKRGNTGKPVISYSGNFAMNQFTDIRETMNAEEYTRSYNEARKYDSYITGGYTPKFSEEELAKYASGEDPLFYPDVDWYDLMLKKHSFTTQHNVNISGGVEKVKYFVSAGYYNQEGLFNSTNLMEGYKVQSAYDRFNFRSNLDFEISKRLSVKLNIASQMENITGNAGDTGRLMDALARANPVESPGAVDGKIIKADNNPLIQFYENGSRKDYRNHLNGSVGLKYKIPGVDGLQFTTTFSYENYYRHQSTYVKNPFLTYTIQRTESGGVHFTPSTSDKPFTYSGKFGKNRRTYFEAGFNYNHKFGKDHAVTALLLYNQSRRVDPNLAYKVANSYQGLVGRVTYDYKSRYLLEFNVGYNGTENFAEGRRFGFFPAYSVGWVASEEPFFPKTDIISFLKLRASYGEVGNDRIGGDRFLYLPTAYTTGTGGQYYFGEVGSTYSKQNISLEGKIGNPYLTWERAKKTNIGVEASFWNNKIKVTADYFVEKRDNILANRKNYAVLFGGVPSAMNFGKMKNGGLEFDVTYRGVYQDLNYWVRGNYTYAHNKIEYMDEVKTPYEYQQRTGQILGQYFGLICDGIYNTWEEVNDPNRPMSSWQNNKIQPGDLIYRDVNGDGIINSYDEVPIGYSNYPEIIYGLSFGGDWKGFDISVLFQGAGHVSLQYSRLYTRGFQENFSAPKSLLESWSQERYEQGLPIKYPHLSEGNATQKHNYQNSTFWTRDASYLRLKNVEIGYTLKSDWLKKLRMSSMRVFINGNNLITWSDMFQGVDPETAQQATNYEPYPITKIYNIGVNIKF